jgi:ubiquinone/menaquinone biosynthesis C-methylase UbiE
LILDVGCGDFCRGDVCLDVTRTKDCQVVADTHYLPFQPAVFDGIHCQCVFEHLSKPTQALKDFLRVLKPGAKFVLLVPKPWLTNNSFFPLIQILLDPFWLLPHNWLYQMKRQRRLQKERNHRHKSVISPEYLKCMAGKLGFKILCVEEMEDGILNSLYYFHRRNRFNWFFRCKPKLFFINRFSCEKC